VGGPKNIGKAPDELKGIESHSFHLESQRFTVQYNIKLIGKMMIIKAVEKVGNYTVKDWTINN